MNFGKFFGKWAWLWSKSEIVLILREYFPIFLAGCSPAIRCNLDKILVKFEHELGLLKSCPEDRIVVNCSPIRGPHCVLWPIRVPHCVLWPIRVRTLSPSSTGRAGRCRRWQWRACWPRPRGARTGRRRAYSSTPRSLLTPRAWRCRGRFCTPPGPLDWTRCCPGKVLIKVLRAEFKVAE